MPHYEFLLPRLQQTIHKDADSHRIQGRYGRLSALWQRGSGAEMVLPSHSYAKRVNNSITSIDCYCVTLFAGTVSDGHSGRLRGLSALRAPQPRER